MKLYEYRIIYSPKKTKEKDAERAKVLVSGELLATNDKEVNLLCARMIPEDFITKLDEVEVAVRPF